MFEVGIVFGCFAPMHRGHYELIMHAKKTLPHVVVAVCGYNGDRGEQVGLPLEKRVQYAREAFEDDEIIKVIRVSDSELGLDESMSASNWDIWIEDVIHKVQNLYSVSADELNVTWFVSEKPYCENLEKARPNLMAVTQVIFHDRLANPISGTRCREMPILYWEHIIRPFRRPFTRKILVAGTASEGKSTLVKDIAMYYDMPYTTEKGRDSSRFMTDEQFDSKVFIHNLYEQNEAINEAIDSPGNHGYIISDTDNIVTLMYAAVYSTRKNFALSWDKDIMHLLEEIVLRYPEENMWDMICTLPPHGEFVDDGTRYMPDQDMDIRNGMYSNLIQMYHRFYYEFRPWGSQQTQFITLDQGYHLNYIMLSLAIYKDMFETEYKGIPFDTISWN